MRDLCGFRTAAPTLLRSKDIFSFRYFGHLFNRGEFFPTDLSAWGHLLSLWFSHGSSHGSSVLDKNQWFKKIACGALFLEMSKILSKMVLYTIQKLLLLYQEKSGEERIEKKRNGKKKGLGEKSFFNASESEPSEREARETCERTRKKSVTGHKVSAPALLKIEWIRGGKFQGSRLFCQNIKI